MPARRRRSCGRRMAYAYNCAWQLPRVAVSWHFVYPTPISCNDGVLMTTKSKFAITLLAAALAATAYAQQPAPVGGVAVASEPGKAAVVGAVEISAQVVAIDKATRTVTLKGPKGKVVDIVAGEQVKNFDQIKVGDLVVARYAQALTLELRKTRAAGGEAVVKEEAAKAKAGREARRRWRADGHAARRRRRRRSESQHDHAQGSEGQRSHARCAQPRPVQGRQEGRPGRGDLHRSARAFRRAGTETGGRSEEVGRHV